MVTDCHLTIKWQKCEQRHFCPWTISHSTIHNPANKKGRLANLIALEKLRKEAKWVTNVPLATFGTQLFSPLQSEIYTASPLKICELTLVEWENHFLWCNCLRERNPAKSPTFWVQTKKRKTWVAFRVPLKSKLGNGTFHTHSLKVLFVYSYLHMKWSQPQSCSHSPEPTPSRHLPLVWKRSYQPQ